MFDGDTYDPDKDGVRLSSQFERVKALMQDGQWRTLEEIATHVKGSQAACSARLRDLKKPKFGGYLIEKRRLRGGLWEYRMSMQASTQRPAPERFTPKDMQEVLEILRRWYPTPEARRNAPPAIKKLGRWLATNVESS